MHAASAVVPMNLPGESPPAPAAVRTPGGAFRRKLLEPTVLLTVVTALLYYVGYTYLQGYYQGLGIPHSALALDHAEYVRRGFEVAMPAAFAAFVASWVAALVRVRNPRVGIAFRAMALLAVVGLVTWSARRAGQPWTCPCVVAAVAFAFSLFSFDMDGAPWHRATRDAGVRRRVILPLVGLLVVVATFVPHHFGIAHGHEALEGERGAEGPLVRLAMTDETHPLHGQCMQVALEHEGWLYLLPLASTLDPLGPGLHSVPLSDVRLMLLTCQRAPA